MDSSPNFVTHGAPLRASRAWELRYECTQLKINYDTIDLKTCRTGYIKLEHEKEVKPVKDGGSIVSIVLEILKEKIMRFLRILFIR